MHQGIAHRLIKLFKDAFDQLDVEVDLGAIEDLAVLIYKGMSVKARNYHNLDHVFSLIDEESPIITITALFHDLVYCQVDLGFLPAIRAVISPYIREQGGQIWIADSAHEQDPAFQMALGIFGFQPGQLLTPAEGLNEFLSAVVMVKKLENYLSRKDLLRLLLCVEATIPFRDSTMTGIDHFYILEERALRVDQALGLDLGVEGVQAGVKQAVVFANRDVDSFAESDVVCYLETTWKLIPETNVALRSIEFFSIREYRQALQSMYVSINRLMAEKVFHQYRGVPGDESYRRMVDQARQNIETGREYLRIKLVSQAILEALAEETGGDAPLSLFMGDLPHQGMQPQRLDDFLPDVPMPAWVDPSSALVRLLADERSVDANFDLRTAALSYFVYCSLAPDAVGFLLEKAQEMFAGKLSPADYLAEVDPDVLTPIASASARMAFTRKEQLARFMAQ